MKYSAVYDPLLDSWGVWVETHEFDHRGRPIEFGRFYSGDRYDSWQEANSAARLMERRLL